MKEIIIVNRPRIKLLQLTVNEKTFSIAFYKKTVLLNRSRPGYFSSGTDRPIGRTPELAPEMWVRIPFRSIITPPIAFLEYRWGGSSKAERRYF